jgi:hypothetical protein
MRNLKVTHSDTEYKDSILILFNLSDYLWSIAKHDRSGQSHVMISATPNPILLNDISVQTNPC